MPRKSDPLSSYRSKRVLERTPEPAGSVDSAPGTAGGGLFVVHKHAARRLHFDLRLEMEGVLRSWAVPKGPSYNPADKRLAVLVEDHPLEYGDFEGLIPEGNYGAGAVIVWDRGRWKPVEDPLHGMEQGKLLFELHGHKLRGLWTLVKLKKGQSDWLLIKERDGQAATEDQAPPPEESVLSGLTVEDLKAGRTPADGIRAELRRLNAPARQVSPASVRLMLAEPRQRPFTAPGWIFELKLDGYRALATRDGSARLLSRNGNDLAPCFPEVVQALRALPCDRLILDGELVTLDEAGRPSFQRLQQRAQLRRPIDIRHAAVECPVTYYAFDLLGFEDFDLRGLPVTERKALLRKVLPPAGVIRFLDHFADDGEVLYQQVRKLGLEGIVGKRADSPYKAGRSPLWLKVRARRTEDFVIVGFTAPKGHRAGVGALLLASYQEGRLTFSGRAGSGLSERQLLEVRETLEGSLRPVPACGGLLPEGDGIRWVEPRLVCEVEFTEWTEECLLRQPVFLRFRDDKKPEECVVSGAAGQRDSGAALVVADDAPDQASSSKPHRDRQRPPRGPAAPPSPLSITNEKKIFWPEDGYTKGDLIRYYQSIAQWILPYLADRPVVLTRYPDGIAGKSFYQMDAPAFVPDWVRTERMWSEQAQREIDYFICDDESSLLYLVNLGTVPLHVWSSRISVITHPDWCILDLDPKDAPFADVVTVAKVAHALCQDIGLPSFVKTTGSSGLHVMIPLGRQCRHDQARSLGELLARLITAELPDISTLTRQVSNRGGKVYVDYLQNGSGRLIVAPFSVRPLPGAPVSMPLKWSEVTPKLDIRSFTIANVADRMRRLKRDPMVEVLELAPDIGAALEQVGKRAGRA